MDVWDLLFQLMKHGTSTLQVAFIFLFCVIGVMININIATSGGVIDVSVCM